MAAEMENEQLSLGLEIPTKLSSNPNTGDISVPCDPSDEDEVKVEISSRLTEIHISEDHFEKYIIENVDKYLNLSKEQQVEEFENIWNKTFGIEDNEEELRECQANFSDLYSLFGIECSTMETKQAIHSLFSNLNFDMNSLIENIKEELLYRFHSPFKLDQSEKLVYPLNEYHSPIKEMIPYNGRSKYDYLCQDSLYKMEKKIWNSFYTVKALNPLKWIPDDCHGLIKYCSGLVDHSDIIWKHNSNTQVAILTSILRNPDDMKTSTWEKFINDISSDVIALLKTNASVTHAVVKQIIHALYFRIKLLNYEIEYILAALSNTAERTLSSLVFAYAFKYLWEKKQTKMRENQCKKESKKRDHLQYFIKTIEEHEIIVGSERLNRDKISKSGVKIYIYAIKYIGMIENALKSFVQTNVKTFFEKREDSLSHASLLSLANDLLQKELAKKSVREVTDVNNFVVQFICNRNAILQRLFHEKWDELELLLYSNISEKMKNNFDNEMTNIKSVIDQFISELEKNARGNFQCFNSDRNFELAELNVHDLNDPKIKKLPFKAVTHYLKMYLDPKVPLGKFIKHFGGFEIDGIKVTVSDSFVLCSKPIEPILELETFEKLEKTGMFDSTQLILNIYDYIKQFQVVLENFRIEIGKNEFKGMVEPFKTECQKKIFGCPSQCPSCGKFCEREVHTNEGKCQIKTGHQISSMGGKVWNKDKDNTAVLFMCDDYKNYTRVTSLRGEMTWGEFKDKCGSEWNWTLPTDKMNTSKQLSNQKIMKDVWNKFGRGILNYYETQGTRISYVPYTDSEEVEMWRQRSGGRGSVSSGDLKIFIDYKT